jgi:ABC-2 type transport system permease protein
VLAPYVTAVLRSFQQQWKQMFIPSGVLTQVLSAVGPAVALGYVAGLADNPTAVSYVFVGAALSATWTMGVFRTGWSLANEHSWGTLDLLMTTRTPVALIMLGKTLGIIAFVAIGGVVAFAVVLGVSRQAPAVDDAALFLASACVALVSLIALCFVFAPFSFLAGVRGGFFNALMPLGTVVSGFLYPIDVLPRSLEVVARLLPTAWAMQAVVDSIDGGASSATILLHLAVALALSAALIALACLLFVEAEQRVRLSGNLGSV